jgi:hypothetical protein
MARKAYGLGVTSTTIGGEGFRGGSGVADPVNTVSTADTVAALADVVADVAVLVADAASPTQAHVTTLDGHLTTLVAAWDALLAGTGGIPSVSDIVLSYDTTAVGNRSVLKRGIQRLLDGVAATNDFAS